MIDRIWSRLKDLFGKQPEACDVPEACNVSEADFDVVVMSGPMPEWLRNTSLPYLGSDEDDPPCGCGQTCDDDDDDGLCPECGFDYWICECDEDFDDDFDEDDDSCDGCGSDLLWCDCTDDEDDDDDYDECFGDDDCGCCCCTGTCWS